MRIEVEKNGYYIAPAKPNTLYRFTSVQAIERNDGQTEVVTRYLYSYDPEPEKLPTHSNFTRQITPWELNRLFDISSSQARELLDFWKFQQWLEHSYYIEPYTPTPTEKDLAKAAEARAKAEEEKRVVLEQTRLKAIEIERLRAQKNEQQKLEWPYRAGWWPKNTIQIVLFTLVLFFLSLLACLVTAVLSNGNFYVFLGTFLTVFAPAFLAAGPFNPYFYEGAPLPPEPPAPPPPSFRQRLEDRLRAAIMEHDYAIPPPEVMDVILSVGEAIYNAPRTTPHTGPRPGDEGYEQRAWDAVQAKWKKADELVFEAVVQSLSAYISNLPTFDSGPFTMSLGSTSVSGSAINDIMRPFTFNQELKELGLAKSITDRFTQNVGAYTYTVKKPLKTLWPQRYQGKPEDIVPTYLQGTPMQILFDVLVPYNPFTDEMRFTHHWCMGNNGSGKTTFLRHLIQHDMDRVARQECSLIVMDSKGLAREMRTIRRFDEGEDLDGRVVIIDSDAVFPLNPFYLPKPQGTAVLTYMLSALSDASFLQTGALLFYIEAAYSLDKPSLYTIQKLMDLPKIVTLADVSRFDKDTKHWFLKVRPGLHGMTSGGLEQRLAIFLKQQEHGLARSLNADGWALDLFGEFHKGGKVLLVDTNRDVNGKDGAALLGRLVIALVDQLATRRNNNPGPPFFVVIDEAQDYIAKDEIFADILEKARSSKVGVTIAHHHLKQAGGFIPGVVAALEQVGIKTRCHNPGSVHVKTRKEEFDLPIKPLEFEREQQNENYLKLRDRLASDYPYKPTPPPKDNSKLPPTQKF